MKTPLRHYVLASAVAAVLCTAGRAAADYASTVTSHSPIGYWRLNEAAGSPPLYQVINSGSIAPDGNGYVVLDPTEPLILGNAGVVGTCVRLVNNGNVVADARSKIDVPFRSALNPAIFSVEFWAKPNGLGSDATGFSPLSSFNPNWYGGANRSGFLFYLNSTGRWQFRMGLTSGYAAIVSASGGNATVGTWQHIVATYDGTTARLYVDGVQRASGAVDPSWLPNTQMALRMGGTPLTGNQSTADYISATGISGNRCFDGWLDEVAVYNSVLSSNTVTAHHDAVATNNAGYHSQILASTPVGYWELDDASMSTPSPTTFPVAANSGSALSAGDATNMWGALSGQPGPNYPGMGAGNNASFLTGEGGYLAVKDAPTLHFSGNITLMAWIKPGTKDFYRNIISHGWDANFAETFLRISRSASIPPLTDTDGYGTGYLAGNPIVNDYYSIGASDGVTYYDSADYAIPPGDIGNWVFLAGTYDGSQWNLYRNGLLVSSFVPTGTGALDVANTWTIGSRSDSTDGPEIFNLEGYYFGGSIDEPAIFNTALSDSDINALYNAAQVPPVITRAPTNPATLFPFTVYKGTSQSFSVWAEGSPTLTYLWTSNNVSTGVTATNITINNFQVGSQTIAVTVNNSFGSTASAVTFNVVQGAPSFSTTPPTTITRYTGRSFTISPVAIGSLPMSFQWYSNNVAIPGATSITYSDTAVPGLNGVVYTCLASNEVNSSVISSSATLTVLPIPSAYAGAVLGGATTPFAFYRLGEASGSTAHDFWSGIDGTYFSASLGLPGASPLDTDTAAEFNGGLNSYVGKISGTTITFPGHTNFTIELWANGPEGQADETTLVAKGIGSTGTAATEQFGIDVSAGVYHFFTRGGGNLFYDCYAQDGPNGTWQHVVGVYADTSMYIYVNGELQGIGSGRPSGVRASSDPVVFGSKRTGNDPNYNAGFSGTLDEIAIYTVALDQSTIQGHYGAAYGLATPPTITLQPVSVTTFSGLATRFSIGAYGTVPLSYVWKHGSTTLTDDGVHIFGATTHNLTITNIVSGDAGPYHVEINNPVGPLTNSSSATLTVLNPPTATPYIPGLVMHQTFDGNLTDATGRGNNGTGMHVTTISTNTWSPTFVAGRFGQALEYSSYAGPANSQTTNDDYYVDLGVRNDLKFGSATSFTVAFWIKLPLNFTGGDLPFICDVPTSTFGSPGFVFAPSFGPDANGAVGQIENSGSWAFSFFDAGGNGVGYYGIAGAINDGAWHHLVYIMDRENGSSVYLDGNPAFPRKQAGTSIVDVGNADASPAHQTCVGQDPTGTYGESGSADMDDLGVWRRALTPLEATSIYAAALANNLSFSGAFYMVPVSSTQIQLKWDNGTGVLQSAPAVTGPYTDVAGPPASPYTVNISSGTAFYRLRVPH